MGRSGQVRDIRVTPDTAATISSQDVVFRLLDGRARVEQALDLGDERVGKAGFLEEDVAAALERLRQSDGNTHAESAITSHPATLPLADEATHFKPSMSGSRRSSRMTSG